jgi:hypothetical protein
MCAAKLRDGRCRGISRVPWFEGDSATLPWRFGDEVLIIALRHGTGRILGYSRCVWGGSSSPPPTMGPPSS